MFKKASRIWTVLLTGLLLWSPDTVTAQAQSTTPPPAASRVDDPLGRDTPLGTVTGFSRAVHRGDLVVAARYMQLRGRQVTNAESLARNLSVLLDRYYTQPLTQLSSSPTGNQADGLDPAHEQLRLVLGPDTYHVLLVRVADPDAGSIWLISSQALADAPTLVAAAEPTWLERSMPTALTTRTFLWFSLAQWFAWIASIVVPMVLLLVAGRIGVSIAGRISDGNREALLIGWWRRLRWPLVVSIGLLVHLLLLRHFGFSLQFRYTYARVAIAVAVVLVGLLVSRLVTLTFRHAEHAALRRGHASTQTLLLLAERVAKVVVALAALVGLLSVAGLDLTTALAGVGIVGIAVALGAQKTVENLLGGVFLLTDRVIAVGDYCRIADREGWIEDVTLRSVRLRTLQQTLLSVPAGVLSQGSIENYSTRGKILIQTRLRLRYGATVNQLQRVLDGIRKLVAEDARLEQASARVRLVDFGANGVEIELFAFVETGNVLQFQEVREQVLLRIAALVESAGCAFGAPPQFMYGAHADEQTSGGAAGISAPQPNR